VLLDFFNSLYRSIQKKLLSFCIEGTPAQAKNATKALALTSGQKTDRVFTSLVKELMEKLDVKSKPKALQATLKSLGQLAELAPTIFDTVREDYISFVNELLAKSVR
jgi:hypothetical protein